MCQVEREKMRSYNRLVSKKELPGFQYSIQFAMGVVTEETSNLVT